MKRGNGGNEKKLKKLIQLEQKDSKKFRKLQWVKQKKQCAILKQKITLKEATVDHKHKLKDQIPGPNGRGLVRGVLHFQANSLEGVIVKKYKRYGVHKLIDLPSFLRSMADYLENPPVPGIYIHWTEKPKPKILGKREYNRIKKYYFQIYPNRTKMPEYPKSKRMTKKWEKLIHVINTLFPK